MERFWRQVSALLVLLALLAAACGSDPTEVVVGDDTSSDLVEETEDTTDDAMEDVADVADVSGAVADDSAPIQTGPVSDKQREQLEQLEQAHAMWVSNGIEDYDFTLVNKSSGDFDDGPIASAYEIEVRAGQVERVLPDDDFSPELTDFEFGSLLEELPDAILYEQDFVVEFDDTFGIPTVMAGTVDDGEMLFRIENFRVAGDYPDDCSTAAREANIDWSAPETAVENTRQQILLALTTCDFLTLSYLAQLGEEPLLTSFGGSGVEQIWEAEAASEPLMTILFDLLEGEPAAVDRITSWPAEFTDSESDYLDWRVGISSEGEWLFFIAGD